MSTNTIRISAGIAASLALLLGALPVFALTVNASASVSAQVKANAAARLPDIIARGDADVAARITALNDLNTRVQAIQNESATEKANISAQVQTNIAGLSTLKAKVDADATASTARSDDQSIFTAYRIYALVVPQGWILASADRVTTITGLMSALGTKMQARITTDQSAGKNVSTLVAALADMNAKITDANDQAASAQAAVSGLTPDQGNATVAASNHAALVAARADIKTATKDLQAARQDVKTILQGLKSLGGSASGSTTVSQ